MVQSCYVFSHSNNQWEKLESQSGQDIDSNLFSCVLSLEAQVSHPIATSIVSYLQSLGVCEKEAPTTIHRLAGVGVSGSWGNKSNLSLVSQVSASKYMEFSKIKLPLDLIWELEAASQSVVVAILDQQPAAIFGIENAIKQSAKSLIEYCKQHEISCSLLSGDTAQLTEKIGTELGLPEGQALGGCSPEAKVSFIEELKKQHTVMMVGDGANDAGALRTADVGVAMGGGAELSLAAAPVFLATDQPRTVMELITGAKNTISTVRLNIGISVCYNTVGATLAILGYINPLVAAVLMPLSSLSVVAISLLRPSFQKKS
jgi:Cu2+-exporting ATPase